jgi:leucyl-tRNA synthetase
MTAALNHLGIVSEAQPVRSLLVTGMVKQDGRKMSKSSGNSIDPEQLIERYGADAVRIAVLWAAAPDQDFNWRDDLIRKAAAFLRKIRQFVERRGAKAQVEPGPQTERAQGRVLQIHRWVTTAERHVTDCLERNAFHIAITQIAMLVDRLSKDHVMDDSEAVARALASAAKGVLRLMAPLAPHLAEELWAKHGGDGLIASEAWPLDLWAPEWST